MLIASAVSISILALVFGGWVTHRRLRYNPAASCANCRSFIYPFFNQYAVSHDGWYPKGGETPMDSLAQLITNVRDVHFFTSHALQPKLIKYWEKNKTFSPEFCCYRYNEGLREDGPSDLIVMYYFKPTRWECNYHKCKELGRIVTQVSPIHSWKWIPENELCCFSKFFKRVLEVYPYHDFYS